LISTSDLTNGVTIAIFFGFVLGKPIGVFGFILMGEYLGITQRPKELSWVLLAIGSILTGIGFTMATFSTLESREKFFIKFKVL
jgi:NhaA family Na+:H+ antiporter